MRGRDPPLPVHRPESARPAVELAETARADGSADRLIQHPAAAASLPIVAELTINRYIAFIPAALDESHRQPVDAQVRRPISMATKSTASSNQPLAKVVPNPVHRHPRGRGW